MPTETTPDHDHHESLDHYHDVDGEHHDHDDPTCPRFHHHRFFNPFAIHNATKIRRRRAAPDRGA